MTSDQEYQLKQMAGMQAQGKCGTIGAKDTMAYGTNVKCAMPLLRERIHDQRCRAQVESRRIEQLAELEHLLDKNPETARILELLELVKY